MYILSIIQLILQMISFSRLNFSYNLMFCYNHGLVRNFMIIYIFYDLQITRNDYEKFSFLLLNTFFLHPTYQKPYIKTKFSHQLRKSENPLIPSPEIIELLFKIFTKGWGIFFRSLRRCGEVSLLTDSNNREGL